MQHHKIIPSANVFVLKGTKVLLGRRANTGWLDGHLCPFGGHIEKGETPRAAITREIREELGVAIDPTDLEFICVAARNNSPFEYVAYEFVIRDKDYQFRNAEPEKCSEFVWVDMYDLPDGIIDHFRQVIERSILADKPYLELGYDSITE